MLGDPETRTRRAGRAIGLFGFLLLGCALAFSSASLAATQGAPQTGGGESVELSAEIAAGDALLNRLQDELSALRKEGAALDESMARIERRAAVYALGREFAQTLTEEKNQLPGPERFERGRAARNQLLASTSDSNLRVERQLDALRDRDAAGQAGLGGQIGLLSRLDSVQNQILLALRAIDQEERKLERAGELARTRLDWLPVLDAGPSQHGDIGELLPALGWMVSPGNWSARCHGRAERVGPSAVPAGDHISSGSRAAGVPGAPACGPRIAHSCRGHCRALPYRPCAGRPRHRSGPRPSRAARTLGGRGSDGDQSRPNRLWTGAGRCPAFGREDHVCHCLAGATVRRAWGPVGSFWSGRGCPGTRRGRVDQVRLDIPALDVRRGTEWVGACAVR